MEGVGDFFVLQLGDLSRMANAIGLSTNDRLGNLPEGYDPTSAKGLRALLEVGFNFYMF